MFPFHIETNLLTFPRQHLLLTKNLHFLSLHASQLFLRFLYFKKLISLVSLAYPFSAIIFLLDSIPPTACAIPIDEKEIIKEIRHDNCRSIVKRYG